MWAWNCCHCLQYSVGGARDCLVCGQVPACHLLIPRCNLVSSSKSLSCCLVLLVPRQKVFSWKKSVLHIGLVDSKGEVLDWDEFGMSWKTWTRKRPRLLEIPLSHPPDCWDELLKRHADAEAASKSKFDKRGNNCLDFVVRMFNRSNFSGNALWNRHDVSGLLLASWLGRYQLQKRLDDLFLSSPTTIWLICPDAQRKKLARKEHDRVCDSCSDFPEATIRSCIECRLQLCSLCVYLHVCVPVESVKDRFGGHVVTAHGVCFFRSR